MSHIPYPNDASRQGWKVKSEVQRASRLNEDKGTCVGCTYRPGFRASPRICRISIATIAVPVANLVRLADDRESGDVVA